MNMQLLHKLLKKAQEKPCTPILPQYVSKSFYAAWLIRFMNEPSGLKAHL